MAACYRYVFTLNTQENIDLQDEKFRRSFIGTLKEHCKKWIFQLERAPTTGTLHYQGRVSLKTKLRKADVIKQVGESLNIAWEVERDESASEEYTCKEDTRVDGPWSHKDVAPYVPRKIRNLELRGWQKDLYNALADRDDDRTIHFVLDKAGGIGKSTFCKFMACRGGAIVLPGTISDPDNLMKLAATSIGRKKEGITFLLDLPRAIPKNKWESWLSTLEQLKDGHITDWRYAGINDWIEPPSVCVFTNSLPPPECDFLTSDRWKIHTPPKFDAVYTGPPALLRQPSDAIIDLSQDSD